MPVYSTAETKIFIGGVKTQKSADFIVSDFNDETWLEIGETETLGTYGDSSEEVAFTGLGDSRTRRVKGPRSAGSMDVTCGLDHSDAGQKAVIAAETQPHDYAFKVVMNDAPAGGTPSERYFIAQVGGAQEQLDNASSVMKLVTSLWVNSNIVRVDAATA